MNNRTTSQNNNIDPNIAKIDNQLNRLVSNYYTAECECNAPKFAFWVSSEKRRKCQEAKMNTFISFTEVLATVIEVNQQKSNPELIQQTMQQTMQQVDEAKKSWWSNM